MKIQRKYMAHYLNAAFSDPEASYVRLGNDLEEYAPELSANVEKKANILGQTTVVIDSYQKQGEVSPYYAEEGAPLACCASTPAPPTSTTAFLPWAGTWMPWTGN